MAKDHHPHAPRKKSFSRRISERWYEFTLSVSKAFGRATDYYEWSFHRIVAGVGRVFQGVSGLFVPKGLIDKSRKLQTKRAMERAEELEEKGAMKFLESFEYFFYRCFAGVGNVFMSLYRLVVPAKLVESTSKVIQHKAQDTFWNIRYRLKKVYQWLTPKWLQNVVDRWRASFAVFTKFCGAWFRSRDLKKLIGSVPALLFALPLFASVVLAALYSRTDKIQHYQAELRSAIIEKRVDEQQLFFNKLGQLGYQRTERIEFQAALSLADDGDWQAAFEKVQTLAPEGEPGLLQAHLWIAGTLLDRRVEVEDQWKLIELHASQALALEKDNVYGLRLMMEADLHYRRIDDALAKMEQIRDEFPDLNVMLMQEYRSRNELIKARSYARKAIAALEEAAQQVVAGAASDDPADQVSPLSPTAYLQWASAHELLGDMKNARERLVTGLNQYPGDLPMRKALSQMVSNGLSNFDFAQPDAKMQLKEILSGDPLNPIANLLLARGIIEGNEYALRIESELLADNVLSPQLFLEIADRFALKESLPASRSIAYYKKALQVDDQSSRAWNNLAWILSHREPLQLDKALNAANRAIEINAEPRYMETRGQIMFQLKRWSEAVSDLEAALNGQLPDAAATHRSLAVAYEKLGQSEAAKAHRAMGGLDD